VDGLERLIRAMRQEPGVWFATARQVAEWALETGQYAGVRVLLAGLDRNTASGAERTASG
jgi:hypothetical protein